MRRLGSWKRAMVVGSFGLGTALFLSGRRPAGLVLAGIGLALFASEHPEKFENFWERAPEYIDRGTQIADALSRLAERLRARELEESESGSPYLT